MTESEYRAAAGLNASTLKELRRSPAHYKWLLENPREDTAAFQMGRAVHAAILTPEEYKANYVVAPKVDKRTKAGKEEYESFLASAEGREIISADDAELVSRIAESVLSVPEAVKLLEGTSREQPFFWTDDHDVFCKCRMDALSEEKDTIVDLKTTVDASTRAFTREAIRYGYDLQAAHYMDAYRHIYGREPEWYFIAVEKTAPFAVNVLKADIGFTDHGYMIREELIEKLIECRESGIFPGYGANDLLLPAWVEE